jgi:hypothetical protein
MAVTPDVIPVTGTGVGELAAALPFPSWPLLLEPQHETAPEGVSAQLWASPAPTAIEGERPLTGTGEGLLCCIMPSPSWPWSPRPQHWTSPALVTAHTCEYAVATE